MTPLWRRFAKHFGRNYLAATMPDEVRRFLRVERCFDMSAVQSLCYEVWQELFIGAGDSTQFIFDLGERSAVPCESFWLEFGEGHGLLVETCCHKDSGVYLVSKPVPDKITGGIRILGLCRIDKAGDYFELNITNTVDDYENGLKLGYSMADLERLSRQEGGWVMGAIAVLNSPRARQHITPSRLAGNKYPKAVNRDLKVSQIYIDIMGKRGPRGEPMWTSSPKAYHFVRSHVRRLEGRTTTVRAHWRGDPAFGIRIGRYKVRDKTPTEMGSQAVH